MGGQPFSPERCRVPEWATKRQPGKSESQRRRRIHQSIRERKRQPDACIPLEGDSC